jgi:hypothetical protein
MKPWFGEDLSLEWRLQDRVVSYENVDVGGSERSSSYSAHYLSLSTSLAFDDWIAVESEIGIAQRAQRNNWVDLDYYALTARYWAMSDIVGDPIALTCGLQMRIPHRSALRDRYSLFQGDLGVEAHVALGRECADGPCWLSRRWVVLAFGNAHGGQGWLRSEIAYEKRACNGWWGVHAQGYWALGSEEMPLTGPFSGYGAIEARALDLAFDYTADFGLCGEMTVGIERRVVARNAPKDPLVLRFSYLWRTAVV